jgi:hypothetical protein
VQQWLNLTIKILETAEQQAKRYKTTGTGQIPKYQYLITGYQLGIHDPIVKQLKNAITDLDPIFMEELIDLNVTFEPKSHEDEAQNKTTTDV